MLSRKWELKRDQVYVLVSKDFKLKYNSTALGFLWSLLVPVFSSVIYYFVFGIMMRFNAPNYPLYLLSGTFLWQFFSNVVTMNGRVLLNNANLLKKTSFDRKLLVWGTYFTESIHLLLIIPILFGIMMIYNVTPNWITTLPNLFVCLTLLMFFAVGLGYAYAAANIYFRDLERVIGIFMQMWMFITPIFIPENRIPEKYAWIYVVNPMAGIVRIWRNVFYNPGIDVASWGVLSLVCLGVFLLGRFIFIKLQGSFTEMM
ncbi:MAG: hypothetical protein E7057_02510 [Lentisphaerae bacterium]|nr:hypothetical protein [Lentisphaerota bacterium]